MCSVCDAPRIRSRQRKHRAEYTTSRDVYWWSKPAPPSENPAKCNHTHGGGIYTLWALTLLTYHPATRAAELSIDGRAIVSFVTFIGSDSESSEMKSGHCHSRLILFSLHNSNLISWAEHATPSAHEWRSTRDKTTSYATFRLVISDGWSKGISSRRQGRASRNNTHRH